MVRKMGDAMEFDMGLYFEPTSFKCPECGGATRAGPVRQTLVWYASPEGHNHDDNCRRREYVCENGHSTTLSRRNACPSCDWIGKDECGCHEGKKIAEWPE